MTPSLNLSYKDAARHTDAKTLLALFERAADTYGLEPFTSDGITEARRILDLADQVDRAAWDAKQNKPYKAISTALIDGALDPAEAVAKITQAEHQAKMNEGAHTPASRLAINIRGAAVPHVRNQDETTILEWLSAPFGQAVANASAHADVVDSILGTEPRRDAPGVRSLDHHWAPRANQLKRDRRLARAWEDLGLALDDVYTIAAIVHEMRANQIIRPALTDTRETVWAQVWETIPQGAFTGDTRPGRVREFYRCHRHQHRLTLATASQLDRNAGELPDDLDQIAEESMRMRDRMANAGYQSVFPSR